MERKKQVGRDFSAMLVFCGNLLHCTENLPSEKWIQAEVPHGIPFWVECQVYMFMEVSGLQSPLKGTFYCAG